MRRHAVRLGFCAAVCIGLLAGCGGEAQEEQTGQVVHAVTMDYPAYSFEERAENAAYIVLAEVSEVGDPVMSGTDMPVTPVTLQVSTLLKGNAESSELIYYEYYDTDGYTFEPSVYALKEGMEVVLFLNESGYCYGPQGIFPVSDEYVVLTSAAVGQAEPEDVLSLEVSALAEGYSEQIGGTEVKVMQINTFEALVSGICEK